MNILLSMFKILVITLTALTFSTQVMASQASPINENPANLAKASEQVIHVSVNGLVCDFCARALGKVFSAQDAVSNIHVDLDKKVVTVNVKAGKTIDDKTLTQLITDSGYSVEGIHRAN